MHDTRRIGVDTDLLGENERYALDNREAFTSHGVYVANLMSSPGAGKTSLLERTVEALGQRFRVGVIEGDIVTSLDADRIARLDVPVVGLNTGGACHLDARQVSAALDRLDLRHLDVVFIENVGNLVCPAEFDLGEHDKVMLLSVTEGDDKPAKYPVMFHRARVMVVNKMDLVPHTDFDLDLAIRRARKLNLDLEVFPLSCRTGEGLSAYFAWLEGRVAAVKGAMAGGRS